MGDPAAGPVVPRMLLGQSLRRHRVSSGISPVTAGLAISASDRTIKKLERGRAPARLRDVIELCELYGVSDLNERTMLLALARQASIPGWWAAFKEIIPDWFEPYIELEQSAAHIRTYEIQFVPGLFQTPDYARAVIGLDKGEVPAAELDFRLTLRRRRQERLLAADAPRFWAIIDEAVLRRHVGSRTTMFHQLQHLIELCDEPNVTIQILQFSDGGHFTGGGPIILLSLPETDLPEVVYLEQLTTALYLDRPEEVGYYRSVLSNLQEQASPPAETPRILERIMRGL
jgi:hypothetical protein